MKSSQVAFVDGTPPCGGRVRGWRGPGFDVKRRRFDGVALLLACLSGCWGRTSSVSAPSIDADAATQKAFEIYDANRDEALDEQELAACPGVLDSLSVYDSNSDRRVDRLEFATRVEAWQNSSAMMSVNCRVTLDGRVLSGAEVHLDPEPYLSDWLREGSGTTNPDGVTGVGVSPDLLPENLKRIRAMYAGTYKVRITHPTVSLPEKYNSTTTLGKEVSAETRSPFVNFELKSK